MKPSPTMVWSIATIMVTIVSCCSLVGVTIVPLLSGPSYKNFITLFTGLAVGSLLGSAIFSLIPQAFTLHLQSNKLYLWKSLVIFFGIYLFYCSERLLRLYFNQRTKKADEQQTRRDADDQAPSSKLRQSGQVDGDKPNENEEHELSDVRRADGDSRSTELTVEKMTTHNHHHHHHDALEPHLILTKAIKSDSGSRNLPTPKRVADIAPVAWMIIIGDGLHNLIDGLSIGAAFSESISLGVTTSVAVIFEEFPHELGDFAVLISSGMSVRQALCFNFLSACTCYIGMVFGILLGDLTQSASYIFALAGGMFLYISLVDMMGELSAMLEEVKYDIRESSKLLLMQNFGILSGIVIIFILSL